MTNVIGRLMSGQLWRTTCGDMNDSIPFRGLTGPRQSSSYSSSPRKCSFIVEASHRRFAIKSPSLEYCGDAQQFSRFPPQCSFLLAQGRSANKLNKNLVFAKKKSCIRMGLPWVASGRGIITCRKLRQELSCSWACSNKPRHLSVHP